MPVIPGFRTEERIEERVTPTFLETAGAGAVASSIAGVGATGQKFALAFLEKEKESQSREYDLRSNREKKIAAGEKSRDLWLQTNQTTGYLVDAQGRDTDIKFTDSLKEWEEEQTEDYADRAPTDQAREYFLSTDRPATTERLLKAHKQQFNAYVQSNIAEKLELADDISKTTVNNDPEESGRSTIGMANEGVDTIQKAGVAGNGMYFTPQGAIEYENTAGREVALSAIDNGFARQDHDSVMKIIKNAWALQSKAQQEALKNVAESEGLVSKNDTGEFGPVRMKDTGMMTAMWISKGPKGEVRVHEFVPDKKDPSKSVKVDVTDSVTVLPNDQSVAGGMINVEGNLTENRLYPYLTREDVTRTIFRLIKARPRQRVRDSRDYLNEVRDLTARLRVDPEEGDAARLRDAAVANQYKRLMAKSDVIFYDDEKAAENAKIELLSSAIVGQEKDANDMRGTEWGERQIKALPDKLRRGMEELGIS